MNDDGINIDGLYTGLKAFADAVSSLRETVAQVLPSLIEIGKYSENLRFGQKR